MYQPRQNNTAYDVPCTVGEQPKRDPDIGYSLNMLTDSVGSLTEALDVLGARLAPVSRQETMPAPTPVKDRPAGRCELSDALRNLNERVAILNTIVRTQVDLLEL